MDPGLEEAIRVTPPDKDIEAVALLRPGGPLPDALRVVTTFGPIVTCRIPAGAVREVRAHPRIASLKATRVVEPTNASPAPMPRDDVRIASSRAEVANGGRPRGSAVLVLLDWGLDVAHPAFLRPGGGTRTRLLALWDQRDRGSAPAANNPYGYGRMFDRARIDRALATPDPYADLDYHPAEADPRRIGAHGTLTASIAAGSASAPPGARGIAGDADLMFVELGSSVMPATTNLGDSVRIIEAIDWVRRVAGPSPWVINLSLGRTGGDHSGRSLLEMVMDYVVHEAPGRAIVNSAGNYFDKNIAAQGIVQPGRSVTLEWRVAPHDPTLNELEIFYSSRDTFGLEITPPGSGEPIRVALGQQAVIEVDGRMCGRAYHRWRDPLTNDHHIDVFLEPTAPAGAWRVTLAGFDVVDGRFHAWIERDSAVPGAQSRFPPEQASSLCTLGTLATTYRTYVVGAASADGRGLAPFSSSGPTRDGRIKPDLVAYGESVVGARSTPFGAPPGTGGITAQSGTSMAAPAVSGTIARLFAMAPRKLTDAETRALVVGITRPIPGADIRRSGSGLLDPRTALEALEAALKRSGSMNGHSTLDELVSQIADSPVVRRAFHRALVLTKAHLPPDLEVVGSPGTVPEGGVLLDDVLVRVHPGEPVAPLIARITSEAAWSAAGEAEDAEASGPGYYARVAPLSGPAGPGTRRVRRIVDGRQRLLPHHLLLRRRRQPLGPRPIYRGPRPVLPPPEEPIVGTEPLEPGFEEPGVELPEPGYEEPAAGEESWPESDFQSALESDEEADTCEERWKKVRDGLPEPVRRALDALDFELAVGFAAHHGLRDATSLTNILFYTKYGSVHGYCAIKPGTRVPGGKRYDELWRELRSTIVVPVLARPSPPVAQAGGVVCLQRAVKKAAAQPDQVAAIVSGRYEHTQASRNEWFVFRVNQAGRHIEAIFGLTLSPKDPRSKRREGWLLHGDFQADGSFSLFSRKDPRRFWRLLPTGAGYQLEALGRQWPLTYVSPHATLMEEALKGLSEFDLVKRYEWYPLMQPQIRHLVEGLAADKIAPLLEQFFEQSGGSRTYDRADRNKAAGRLDDYIHRIYDDPQLGVHPQDRGLAQFYARTVLTRNKWKLGYTRSQLDWMQFIVARIAYDGNHLRYLPEYLGLTADGRFTGTSTSPLYTYNVTVSLKGAGFWVHHWRGTITIEQTTGTRWKESFSIWLVAGEAGATLKIHDSFSGQAQSSFEWKAPDLPGWVSMGKVEAGVTVGGAKASAQAGFMHIHGRGYLPPLEVLFADTGLGIEVPFDDEDEPGRKRRLKPQAFDFAIGPGGAFGKIGDKRFPDIDYSTFKVKTDYSLAYGLTNDVHFCLDSALLTEDARQALRIMCANELAAFTSGGAHVRIIGHTDRSIPPGMTLQKARKYNEDLSRLRAENTLQAIRDILGARFNVSAQNISAVGKADDEAIRDSRPPKEINPSYRRVDVILNARLVLTLKAQ